MSHGESYSLVDNSGLGLTNSGFYFQLIRVLKGIPCKKYGHLLSVFKK